MNTIKKIQVDGVDYDIQAKELTKVTYAELKEMRDNGSLSAGHLYRITDYEFTTVQKDTKSAGNVFDIIVLATAEDQLSELARAIQHEGDTYFDGNDLGAWELWYDLDNDTDKYEWADADNGKGVIYRMIDEKRNDCPYDFKNALFYNTKLTSYTTTDKYYYTFSYVVSSKLYDGTVKKDVKNCYGNSMGVCIINNKKSLNLNVFRNTSFVQSCYYNTFGYNCYSNTFGYYCYSNTFGYNCNSNIFGQSCYYNTFGDNCYYNIFGQSCYYNTFGDNCYYNTFGQSCRSNIFGDNCNYNTFGDNCYSNTFGYNCNSNTFGYNSNSNTFGNYCYSNTFGYYYYYNTFGNYCYSNTFGNNCYYNIFGYSCYSNIFGDNFSNREINSNKTSITLNDEYYDDGSGKLVPIKHPDLSTQPSILPYKFMGQYVYELLIPVSKEKFGNSSYTVDAQFIVNSIKSLPSIAILQAEEVLFCRNQNEGDYGIPMFYRRCVDIRTGEQYGGTGLYEFNVKAVSDNTMLNTQVTNAYLRIVYTSMPEEGGNYYEYNNY